MSAHPPRLAEWLVEQSLPVDRLERDAVLGDLAEEHTDRIARIGVARAHAWYWVQAARSIGPNVRRRLTRPATHVPAAPPRGDTMDSIAQDIRYAWRMILRRPGVTAVALASLVIGISLSTVVFSLLNAVLLRPLPVTDPDRLAVLLEARQTGVAHNFSYPDFTDYRAGQRGFEELAAYSRAEVTVRQSAGSQVVAAELVSGGYFDMLGVRLRFGRGLTHSDDSADAAAVVVVSDRLWRQLAGDASFTPRTLTINERNFAVVGVAAEPFRGVEVGRDARIWAPLHAQPLLDGRGRHYLPERQVSWLTVMGRLRPGTTRDAAAADLNAV